LQPFAHASRSKTEILALRHQIIVLKRSVPNRPKLRPWDRLLWIWLSRLWPQWRSALIIVKPETVLAWHRKGFRLLRGVYEYPAFSKMLNAPANPDPDAIAQAIARAHGWTIIPSGETALNILGLSTQVTAQWQYFSDGPSKNFIWQGGTLVLKHRTNKETTKLSPKTALVVQALKTLGEDHVNESVLATLREKLDPPELSRAVREARYVTSWIYEIIKRLAAEDKSPHA
jgi:hypothetical protein